MKTVEGDLMGGGQRHCVVVTRWNDFIVSRLQEGALSALRRHGVNEDDVTLVVIPGAFEMGTVVRELARSGKYDAVTCLGAVIKGSTDHYDFVAGEAAGQISRAGYETGVPVISACSPPTPSSRPLNGPVQKRVIRDSRPPLPPWRWLP